MKKNSHLQSPFKNPGATHRPIGVTILILVVLIFTSLNALRMITAIRTWDFLVDSPVGVPVIYLVITGAIWMGIGLPLVFGLLTGRKWSPIMVQIAIILYICYYWFDRLLIADRSAIAGRWQFTLGLTIMLLIFTFWTLTRPQSKVFFKK
jgi:hypothetical protein